MYGKGTAAALKAYNKEYLGDAELTKTANVNALLSDDLKPKSIGELAVKCKDEPKNCYTGELCNQATYRGPSGDLKWSAIYENHVKEARSRGLSCLVKEDKNIAENAKDDAPEPTPKLDIARVQASYDAKDYTKAFADAQVLAVQGDPEAQLLLGKMFVDGRGTIQVSTVAHMWFNIASMGGLDEAYEQRKAMTAQMTPSAVEEAQKMAMKCIQSNYADCGLAVTPTAVAQSKILDKTYITDGSQVGPWFKDETLLKRKQLQYALKKLGVYNSSVDGLWGANTSRAFTRYINKDKRDAENVEEVFASVLSKVKVPSSFASTNRSTKQNKSTFSVPSGWRLVTNNPQHSFEQANAICKPISENAGESAKTYKPRTNSFNCFGNSYSVNCNRNSGGFAEGFAGAFVTGMNRKKARQRAFASCMAEYGWVEK